MQQLLVLVLRHGVLVHLLREVLLHLLLVHLLLVHLLRDMLLHLLLLHLLLLHLELIKNSWPHIIHWHQPPRHAHTPHAPTPAYHSAHRSMHPPNTPAHTSPNAKLSQTASYHT
jgi:hypothetical protein